MDEIKALEKERAQLILDMHRVRSALAKQVLRRALVEVNRQLEESIRRGASKNEGRVGVYSFDAVMSALARHDEWALRIERAKTPVGLAGLADL